MPDNYRNNNANQNKDNIDDFFSQFDQPSPRSTPERRSDTRVVASRSEQHRSTSSANRRNSNTRRTSASRSSKKHAASATESARGTAAATVENRQPHKPAPGSGKRGGGKNGKTPGTGRFSLLKAICLAALAMVMAVGICVGLIMINAPEVKTDNIYDQISQRSVMYDSQGKEIENLYLSDGNRTIVKYDDIPEDMVNAVVAIEDKKFWKHHGFNYTRLVGAVLQSVGGGNIRGTSTVTQQLARNVYLAEIKDQRSMSRKIAEMYCTIILEKNLSKEQIMEAYLNTIYLGFNSYGIQAAAQSYFSKDVQDLTTLECAALAALPQSPDTYALIKADYNNSDSSLPKLSSAETVTYLYNGDISKERRNLVLQNMASDGFISAEQKDDAMNDDLKKHMKIGVSDNASATSYFTDYAITQLVDDIVAEYGIERSDAQNMIYTGGLKIYTTMDSDIQGIVEEEFKDDDNYASVAYIRTNSDGDLLNSDGQIMSYAYSHYFNDKDQFVLKKSEYTSNSDGSITIKHGKRLNIYETEVNGQPDVSIEFKGMYVREDDGSFYFIKSGALSIPQGYKTVDSNGDVVISAQLFQDYPDLFKKSGDKYIVSKDNYSLQQKTRQPQAAIAIMENSTGELKAMVGGRGTTGKQLYNRATSTRQPGSSIKPIAVYGPALQRSYEFEKDGKTMTLDTSDGSNWGKYITAGSVINDKEMSYGGRVWPKNWYSGYRGQMTLRTAVQQSVNVCAVKVYQQIGPDYSASMLEKVGVTTVDEEGEVNDLNPAALALGGMSSGISPLEMTAAYATFPNGGVYKSPIAYTKVLNNNDELLFEQTAEGEQVYDPGVAWIMTDILRTVVSKGIATNAAISSQPVGGKTGTTSDNYDAWFCGFTPQYTAAMWMGNDLNIELSAGSAKTASFWSKIMGRVCENLPTGSYFDRPDNVVSVGGEYYTDGTYSKVGIKKTKDKSKTTESSTTQEPTTQYIPPATTEPSTKKPTSSSSEEKTDPPTHSPTDGE